MLFFWSESTEVTPCYFQDKGTVQSMDILNKNPSSEKVHLGSWTEARERAACGQEVRLDVHKGLLQQFRCF